MTNQKIYKLKHKELGLCLSCSNPIIKGGRCQSCHNKQLVLNKRYKHIFFEKGKCVHCGNEKIPEVDDNFKTCLNCREQILKPKYKEYSD